MSDNNKKEQEENKETVENQNETQQENTVTEEPQIIEKEELKKEEDLVEQLKKDLDEAKDKYLRLFSEFENFRRRTAKEKVDLINSASEKVLKSLLPVIDDFERAENSYAEKESEIDSKTVIEGTTLILNKIKGVLNREGLVEIEVNAGDDFDTEIMEAITQIPAPTPELKGKIVDCVEKGYKLNDKVVRYAKVVVGA
ncbi:nucleotide exchange factor GrpE [Aureibacter tunicatorum]|uniref:Protein GrpE n=1 Tax=Aureibacter tunicatorum TaxID=866807 RepID=A0AAE3XKF2_9BACT|nr:nucleotide exchange factor GrpE [Aureibacter tunicatorum]MDR6238057.1 molecular chaperone GrpE [Aureibacter tunicatorum]BDD03090.1 protein GrpE [Aureibacter tunicatorum]